jgi:hypothetical protein
MQIHSVRCTDDVKINLSIENTILDKQPVNV